MSVHLKSITGKPAKYPESVESFIPFSTPGIYSFGTLPPTILLSKIIPSPFSNGSNSSGKLGISYNLILNLVSASGSNDPKLI